MPEAVTTPDAVRKSSGSLTDADSGGFRREHVIDETRESILVHAREEFAKKPAVEACGFIVTDGKKQRTVRSPNLAAKPEHEFRTCPKVWREIEDGGSDIVAAYHSHVNEPPTPSQGDRTVSEKLKLPFLIAGMPTEVFGFYAPTGWRAALEGRPFIFGILDCMVLVQDAYREKLGIVVPDFDYEVDWWMPLKEIDGKTLRTTKKGKVIEPPLNLYVENFGAAGFVEVRDLRKWDLIFIQIPPSDVANHCVIYLGDGMIVHHLAGRLSKREPWESGKGYAQGVVKIVRHKSLC